MRDPARRAFTLVELLVVIAIIGVLVAILLPAVQQSRESARGTQCRNQLRQVALAAHLFHDTRKVFPPARYQPRPGDPAEIACGGNQPTWVARILPYLEQQTLSDRWDFRTSFYDHPEEVRTASPVLFSCPTRRGAGERVGLGLGFGVTTVVIKMPCGCSVTVTKPGGVPLPSAVGDYGANHGDMGKGALGLPTDFYHGGNGTGIMISSRAKCDGTTPVDWIDRIAMNEVTDGLANTFLVGEMHVPLQSLLTHPGDGFLFNGEHLYGFARVGGPTVPIISNLRDEANGLVSFGSWHPGVCHFAYGDGRVTSVSNQIDTEVYGNLCNRQDGEAISGEY